MNPSIVAALLPLLIIALIILVLCRKLPVRKEAVSAQALWPERKKARITMIVLGTISIAVAGSGIWYNVTALFTDFSGVTRQQDTPYFYPAFYVMSGLCLACYISLLTCGVQFLRSRMNLFRLFVGTVIFEVLYFFTISALWMVPRIGMSVAAATGVASGGLMFQGSILFPLWAPFVARWAVTQLPETESHAIGIGPPPRGGGPPTPPDERIAYPAGRLHRSESV